MGRNALRSAAPGQKAWLREHVLGMAIAGREGGRSRPVKKTDRATPNRLLSSQRKLRYWTQSQVAEQLGTTTVNVNRWERGLTSPSLYFRQKLCDLFGKSAEELGRISAAERHEQVVAATV